MLLVVNVSLFSLLGLLFSVVCLTLGGVWFGYYSFGLCLMV